MEALGPGGERASPRSLDLRQPSTRAASACSSVPGGPEPRTASPGAVLPHLDGDYVRAVWGGPGRLSRRATPLLYALAAEAQAEAGVRASEPPSPPASRAAYRQRLQGAQRRVLRETSFQRRELRMSLPARLRPAAPARLPTAHPRSSSLSHAGGDCRAPAPGAAGQQRKWCFSEPGELDRVGRGGGPAREGPGETCSRPEPRALPCEAGAQLQGTEEPDSGSKKLGGAPWPGSRRQNASGEALGPWRGPGGAVALVQAVPPGVETPRALLQTFSRVLPQKEAAVVCPAEGPRSPSADCEERVAEPCTEPGRLPSLPDDEVFLDEAPLGRLRLPPEGCMPQAALARVHASDPNSGNGLDRATAPPECPLHECPGTAGAEDCWQGVNGSVGVARPTSCSPPGTANGNTPANDSTVLLTPATPSAAESDPLKPPPGNALGPSGSAAAVEPPHHPSLAWGTGQLGSRPTWPSQRLEELVQELAKLDPSLSDALASEPSPEPPLGLLDGLIPLTVAQATVRPGEEAGGTSEPRSYPFSFTQLLPASQEKTRPENATPQPVPGQPCVQELPAPNVSIQAKKVELAGLLQKMLQNLHSEQEQLQGGAEAWSRRRAALEAAVGQSCAPRELERFSRFMADLERVLGLLLLLGSRLARVHRALARLGPDGDPEERASLLQRLGLLQRQQEDAQELKEHVSRRERALREVLARALPEEEVRAYCMLLADKAAVLAQQRNLDEQVRLLQDQLDTIRNDLGHRPLSPRPSTPFSQAILAPKDLSG